METKCFSSSISMSPSRRRHEIFYAKANFELCGPIPVATSSYHSLRICQLMSGIPLSTITPPLARPSGGHCARGSAQTVEAVTRLRKNGRLDSVLRVADFFYWSAEKIVGKLQEQPRYNQKNGNKDYRRCEVIIPRLCL